MSTLPPELTALSSDHIIALEQAHRLPGAQSMSDLAGIVVDRARNAQVWDREGNSYIDFFTGVGVCNIGHSHPRFIEAVSDQLSKVIVGSFYTDVRARYFELLTAQLPSHLDRVHMFSTGSEAAEAAAKFARSATGRKEILTFWGGFHGKTQGALALHSGHRKHASGPFPPGAIHTPYAACYRCPLKLEHPSCGFACVDFAEEAITHHGTGDLAAIMVEPVQGTNGNIVPPPGYLNQLRRLADRHGALLILDEVITGFGRTGSMFAFEHEPDSAPDIVVLGKSMASGLPASAVVSRADLIEGTPFAAPSAAASTFGGNPLASAAALATLEILLDEDLPARAARLGDLVRDRLSAWPEMFPFVGRVESRGLMVGVELVLPGTKDSLPKELTRGVFRELMARGVICMAYDSRIRIYPPLTIPEEQLHRGLDAFEATFRALRVPSAA